MINRNILLLLSYVISYFVFLRLSAWSGGFSALSTFDPISVVKVAIRLSTFFIAFLYLLKYLKIAAGNFKAPFTTLLMFLVFALISLIYSSDPFYSGFRLFEHFGYLMFSLVIVINVSKQSRDAGHVIKTCNNLILYGVGLLIAIVWLTLLIAPEYAYRHLVGEIAGLGGDILQIHTLANVAALMFGVILHRLLTKEGRNTIFMCFLILLMLATVYLTRSRSGLLIFSFVTVLIMIHHRKSLYIKIIFPVSAILILLFIVNNSDVILEYGLRGQSVESLMNLTERTKFWGVLVVDTLNESPLYGYGYQMLSDNGLAKYFPDYGYSISNAHNTFVQTFVGLGVIGITLLCVHLTNVFMVILYLKRNCTFKERDDIFEIEIVIATCIFASFTQYGIVGMTTPIVSAYMMAVCLLAFQFVKIKTRITNNTCKVIK